MTEYTDKAREVREARTQSIYWSTYTPEQQRALLSLPPNDLSSEITLLRILIFEFLQQEVKTPPSDPQQNLSGLQAKCNAALVIASMENYRLNQRIAHPWWEPIVAEAWHKVRLEMGVYDYLKRAERPS